MELAYDWDELIRRLKDHNCTVTRVSYGVNRGGGDTEVYDVALGTREHPLYIPPWVGNPTSSVVRSLIDSLGLPHAPFGI